MLFNNYIDHLIVLIKRIGFILLLFSLSRMIFLLFNWNSFYPFDLSEITKSFLFGIRFDFIVVFYANILFIMLHLFPFGFTNKATYQKTIKGLMIAVNSILLITNFIDTEYFAFSNKRSGWEMITMLTTSSDTGIMLPQYIQRYWHITLLWLVSLFIFIRFFPALKKYSFRKPTKKWVFYTLPAVISVFIMVASMIYVRGMDVKPIRIISANKFVTPKYIPLLLNTPFKILHTINQKSEKLISFFDEDTLNQLYTPLHKPQKGKKFKRMNVMIIILESYGKEYVESLSRDSLSFTPFFDSLAQQGLYCTKAYANAMRSMDALPAIIGGFPSILHTSFVSSAYSINTLGGLGKLLNDQGYATAFFHGGANGTMGFDMFCESVGIKKYFGKREYNNEEDYDGSWGIWDEKFFQFTAQKINELGQPFFSALFSLSSHEPYNIPEKYQDNLFPDESMVLRSIAYTDQALKKFFDTISKTKWYKNTLFVICPDHTSEAFQHRYHTSVGRVSIPIIYFCPGDKKLRGVYEGVTQQLDIMPTILDYLHYPYSYVSFGTSLFTKGYRYSVSFNDINYQIVDSSYCLVFDGSKTLQLNNYLRDSLLMDDLNGTVESIQSDLERHLKAFLQEYYNRLNQNRLSDVFPK